MINDLLNFMAKKSLEVMIADETESISLNLIADTQNNIFDIKIRNTPFSFKVKHIANILSKQNLDYIMDNSMTFTITCNVNPKSESFKELWEESGDLLLTIEPSSNFAEKFLESFSKQNSVITIPAKEIPRFENPQI